MTNTFMLLLVLIPALIIWGVIIYVVYLLTYRRIKKIY